MQAAWMIAASLFFASMGVCIKFASDAFGPLEVVFYRGVISVVFIGFLARARRQPAHPRAHDARGATWWAWPRWWPGSTPSPTCRCPPPSLNYMSGIWIAAFVIGGALALGKLADVRRQGR
jgi:S-adenosylmethionine uptake transporter